LDSGTGASSLFLARALHQLSHSCSKDSNHCHHHHHQGSEDTSPLTMEVIAVPCIGDELYLQKQMEDIDNATGSLKIFPTILPINIKRQFAEPCTLHYDLWKQMQSDTNIPFDLVYAPRSWEIIISYCDAHPTWWTGADTEDTRVMYVHSGGTEGIDSQLARYKYLKLL